MTGSITVQPLSTELLTQVAPATSAPIIPSQITIVSSTPSGVEEHEIPIQSLSKGFYLGTSLLNPSLLLAFDDQGLQHIEPLVEEDDRSLINTINLEKQALLVVIWGVKPAGGYSITIDKIFLADDELTVEVLLKDHDPDFPKIDAATSPYHLVVIDKNLLTNKTISDEQQ